ncbi:MAG: glyceraldehyde 3-phosphate dehydrogenase NAD-binding domain-containing protein [Syntrophales bacterium]|jgi:glyceraldehyde 3-phosphate dehydrogenase|nr:glyceraldehyde 3-phosphate dehydrogenase NAD-binding domain-containing protein [Syntrophales bacterium]
MVNVAINGLGRIGRAALKIVLEMPEFELLAVNDLAPVDNLVYLLKYDTVYGRYGKKVETGQEGLIIDGKNYRLFSEKDPANLPWGDMGIDVVFECTGAFTRGPDLEKHLTAGAKFVVLSAPAKSEDIETIVDNVNEPEERGRLISTASCTTNCIAPIVEIIGRRIGLKKAVMTTIHAYTSSQSIVDGPNKKWTRGRAGAANLVPTSTGAAVATTKALPQYTGKFDGIAVRAPVAVGSLSDMVFLTERNTTVEEVNKIFKEEAETERYKYTVGVTEDPVVSSDIIQDPRASVVDLALTQVVDGDLVKVMSWYDNEWGYTAQMVREAMDLIKK